MLYFLDHYQEHRQEAALHPDKTGFFEFMSAHFFNSDGHEHDDCNSHQNLPFQQIQSSLTLVFQQVFQSLPLHIDPFSIKKAFPVVRQISSSDYSCGIFRPPVILK